MSSQGKETSTEKAVIVYPGIVPNSKDDLINVSEL